VTRRSARFLTRLYPPAWRARFAAEFQTFLESRRVSPRETLDIAGRAVMERVSEGWQAALLVTAFLGIPMFAGCCALYLGAGRHAAWPVLWLCWGAIEAAAVAVCLSMLRSPGPAIRGTLGSWRFIGLTATTLLSAAVLLFLGSGWHMTAGLVILWVGGFWLFVASRLTGTRLESLLAASIVTATLDSLGWGVFYRGYPMVAIWLFAVLPLFEVVKATNSARRIFAGH
jgi:hypothetical protein